MSKSRLLMPVVWAALGSLLLASCSRPEIDTSEIIRPVRVIELQSSNSTFEESFPGQIEPRFQANLSFQVGGKLVNRLVDVGDRVQKGQVLAKLDPQDLSLALQAAQAQFNAASTEQAQLKTDLERAKTLKQQNFISQAELDRRQLAMDAATSRLSQARSQLNTQSNQRQYGDLRAPDNGVVSMVYAQAGQVLSAGQPVVQWANENEVQVRMAVPESRVSDINVGQPASVLLWSGKESLKAEVREVSPVADPVTRTFDVLLDVSDNNKLSRFGMSATVQFSKAAQTDVFKLPIQALVAEQIGAFVWVFDETKGVVTKRMVQPYEVSESNFLVKEGLNNGELIVTAGTHVLNDGQKVRRFIETSDLAQ
ncbi:efflux RND transporter periplasmic adaptor subunit [Limnobacter parvus]|uniref:Efflux RND transporter periplasmic adaptor subunit n=1 Tax=Limnobacter parvus TaxID=2939690 RepID=A0ABT1XJV4_9BURK|nr:efflux RND transporter periplasmic adaptor subunit [Limnobacter parvus]MCR2747568.1 efflux RND transporter periplasmic adaptor subunit [Limnobacter parvus]